MKRSLKPKREHCRDPKVESADATPRLSTRKRKRLTAFCRRWVPLGHRPIRRKAGGEAAPTATTGSCSGDVAKRWVKSGGSFRSATKLPTSSAVKAGKAWSELDNIDNLLSAAEIAKDSRSQELQGGRFRAGVRRAKMPDKYKDLMEPEDVDALAAWLAGYKNASVNTPEADQE